MLVHIRLPRDGLKGRKALLHCFEDSRVCKGLDVAAQVSSLVPLLAPGHHKGDGQDHRNVIDPRESEVEMMRGPRLDLPPGPGGRNRHVVQPMLLPSSGLPR
eukprot:2905729-Alexandrium_andersonii.AAC.1